LDRKIQPLVKMLRAQQKFVMEQRNGAPTVTEIVKGIGWIEGIVAMAGYFMARRRSEGNKLPESGTWTQRNISMFRIKFTQYFKTRHNQARSWEDWAWTARSPWIIIFPAFSPLEKTEERFVTCSKGFAEARTEAQEDQPVGECRR
jgi:hypothetical protein